MAARGGRRRSRSAACSPPRPGRTGAATAREAGAAAARAADELAAATAAFDEVWFGGRAATAADVARARAAADAVARARDRRATAPRTPAWQCPADRRAAAMSASTRRRSRVRCARRWRRARLWVGRSAVAGRARRLVLARVGARPRRRARSTRPRRAPGGSQALVRVLARLRRRGAPQPPTAMRVRRRRPSWSPSPDELLRGQLRALRNAPTGWCSCAGHAGALAAVVAPASSRDVVGDGRHDPGCAGPGARGRRRRSTCPARDRATSTRRPDDAATAARSSSPTRLVVARRRRELLAQRPTSADDGRGRAGRQRRQRPTARSPT